MILFTTASADQITKEQDKRGKELIFGEGCGANPDAKRLHTHVTECICPEKRGLKVVTFESRLTEQIDA